MSKHYTVTLSSFDSVQADNPIKATEKVLEWIHDNVNNMMFEVIDEETQEEFLVDMEHKECSTK